MDELCRVHFREGWLPCNHDQGGWHADHPMEEPLIACRIEQVIEGRSGSHTDRVENVTCGNCLRVLARAARQTLERAQ